jgi:predicted RNA-binding Zn ribbon-like protein
MEQAYAGPLRDEPLAIELHNTIYAAGGVIVDGLADDEQARAWLSQMVTRLALDDAPAGTPSARALIALRDAVRAALRSAVDDAPQDRAVLAAINDASARAPWSPVAALQPSGVAVARSNHHGASLDDVVTATFARDAIELVTGPQRTALRACGAPGCVLLFLRDDPRRAWCCNACGNRARQARHYRRTHP